LRPYEQRHKQLCGAMQIMSHKATQEDLQAIKTWDVWP
jgi:hypothetical protein